MPAPTPDLIANFALSRDWPHLLALVLVLAALALRRLTGIHVDGRWKGFWHSDIGRALLAFGPGAATAVITAAADAIWQTGFKATPIVLAVLSSVLAQISPTAAPQSLADSTDRRPPLKVASWIFVPIVLFGVATLTGASCPTGQKIAVDMAACAIGQVPSAVAGVLPNVVASLQGTPAEWAKEQVSLETLGIDAALCAVKAAIADITHQAGAAGASSPKVLVAIDRANVFLAAHGVK